MAIALSDIINSAAQRAGLSQEYAENFRSRLLANKELLNEFIYFLKNNKFLCEYKVCELSIADIMVYEIDHFKAAMDQDRLDMKFNPDKMLLSAFNEMLDMAENPEMAAELRSRLLSESGTDGTEMGTDRII